MDEFTSFKLSKVGAKNEKKDDQPFKSELGNFTYYQDRMIRFSQDRWMLIAMLVVVGSFLISTVSLFSSLFTPLPDINGFILFLVKFFLAISFVFSALLPIAVVQLWLGGKQKSVKLLLNGYNYLVWYITIILIFFVVVAAIIGIIMLPLLLSAFIVTLIILAIMGGIFYFFFLVIMESKTVATQIRDNFTLPKEWNVKIPNVDRLQTFVVWLIVLFVIGQVFSLGTPDVGLEGTESLYAILSSPGIQIISFLFTVVSMIALYKLLGLFDVSFRGYHVTKQPKKQKHYYDGYEEMFGTPE